MLQAKLRAAYLSGQGLTESAASEEADLGEFGVISDHMVQVITNAYEQQIADPAGCAKLLQKQKNGELSVDADKVRAGILSEFEKSKEQYNR